MEEIARKKPPTWFRQGISAFIGGLIVLLGTIATASVDWKEAEVSERGMISRGYTELFNQLRQDVGDLRAQVEELEAERTVWRMERDSLMTEIRDLTQQNQALQYRVYWLERQVQAN